MRIRLKTYIFLVITVSSIIGTVSYVRVTAQSNPDDYTDAGFASKTLTEQVQGKIFIGVMQECLKDFDDFTNGTSDITESEIRDNTWMKRSYSEVKAGYIVDPNDNGKLTCGGDNDSITILNGYKKAISFDGSSEDANFKLICQLGFRPVIYDTSSGFSSTDDTLTIEQCVNAAKSNGGDITYRLVTSLAPSTTPSFTPAEMYLAYRSAFLNGCDAQAVKFSPEGFPRSTENNIEPVPIVYSATSSRYVDYRFNDPGDVSVVVGSKNKTCRDLVGYGGSGTGNLMNATHQAYKEWLAQNPNDTAIDEGGANDGGGNDTAKSSCTIEGVGWIVCPVINFLGAIVDKSYAVLDGTLLKVEPLPFSGNLYDSWTKMRDIANVVFVIAFLIIVFSQLTSLGVGNYGIKRLLPKIIVAAILVNVSYFICAVAVDVSNISGNYMRSAISSVSDFGSTRTFTIDATELGGTDDGTGNKTNSIEATGWQGLGGVILGGTLAAGTVYVFLPVFIPLLIGALLSVMTVVIALTIRQALIILLIVMSPLAFVALLLPNTEEYFKRWKQLFTAMLLVYPIVSVVFGASALASSILMEASNGNFAIQLVGAGVSIIPLFITPIIMKVSGGLLNRWVGMVNNPNRGPYDAAKKWGDTKAERLDGRRNIEASKGGILSKRFAGGRYRRRAEQKEISDGIKAEAAHRNQQYIAKKKDADGDSRFGLANSAAGGTMFNKADSGAIDRSLARAQLTVENAELEEVKAAQVLVQGKDMTELTKIMENNNSSSARKAAALDRMVAIGNPEDYEKYVNQYGSDTSDDSAIVRRTLSKALAENGPSFLKAPDLDNIKNGQLGKERLDSSGAVMKDSSGQILRTNLTSIAEDNIRSGVISQEKMATDSNGNLKYAKKVADDMAKAGDTKAADTLQSTAQQLIRNPNLNGKIKHNKEQIGNIAGEDVDKVMASLRPIAPATPAPTASPTTSPVPTAAPAPPPHATPTTTPGTPIAPPTPRATPAPVGSPTTTPAATPTAGPTPTAPTPPPGWTTTPAGVVTPPTRRPPTP